MICCKIVANYNDTQALGQLLKELANYGDLLWERNNLFFGNTNDTSVDQDKIKEILRDNGFQEFFLNVYNKDNDPNESDFINGWVFDKLIKINYFCYERDNQEMLKNTSIALDALNKELDRIEQMVMKKQKSVKSKHKTKKDKEAE